MAWANQVVNVTGVSNLTCRLVLLSPRERKSKRRQQQRHHRSGG